MAQRSVLFVCLGNICRSPAAEGICRHMAKHLHCDSAATGSWHVGSSPDPRSQKSCRDHGIDISTHRARVIRNDDWNKFTVIVAMNGDIYAELKRKMPKNCSAKLALFNDPDGIGDPYYGDQSGFDDMYNLISSRMPSFLKMHGLDE